MKEIEAFFKTMTGGLASVRNIGVVSPLGASSRRRRRWQGCTGTLGISSQVSVPGGDHGAICCFVKKRPRTSEGGILDQEQQTYALTAGHVATDHSLVGEGTPVYSPATDAPPDPNDHIGDVADHHLFDRDIFNPHPNTGYSDIDAALIKLSGRRGYHDTLLPLPGVGHLRGVFDLEAALMKGANPARIDVTKLAGGTPLREGWISAVDVSLAILNSDYSMVYVDGLLEISSSGDMIAGFGDSGSLVVTPDGHAVGLLVAGTIKGEIYEKLKSENRPRGKGAAFVIPMHAVMDKLGTTPIVATSG